MGRARVLPNVTPPSKAEEFHFALTTNQKQELERHLFPEEGHHLHGFSERGVIGIITRSTGDRRTTYLLHDVIAPKPGDVYEDEPEGTWGYGLYFTTEYRARAEDAARDVPGGGLIYFHSQPSYSAYPSVPDLRADGEELYTAYRHLGSDVPLAAGIIAEKPRRETGELEWSVRAYEFDKLVGETSPISLDNPERATQTHATAVRAVGPTVTKLPTVIQADGVTGSGGTPNLTAQDSTVQLWGERGQQILAGLRVGVVGLGGVGSLLAEQIARLGVGEAIFVDFDRLKPANQNRAYGATRDDVRMRRDKVEVAARIAREGATAPSFQCRPIVGSVVEDQNEKYTSLPALLDCDVILNAADTHWVRKVLDELAYAHLIPVIDGGTKLRIDEETGELSNKARSEVAATGPGHPCYNCMGVWFEGTAEKGVQSNQLPPHEREQEPYAQVDQGVHEGEEQGAENSENTPRAPSVITTNGLVASLITLRFQALTLGTTAEGLVGSQQYGARENVVQWREGPQGRMKTCKEECERTATIAVGDHYELDTGFDWDLREERPEFTDSSANKSTR